MDRAEEQLYAETVLSANLMDAYISSAISYAQLLTLDNQFQKDLMSFSSDESLINRTKVRISVSQIVDSYMITRPLFSDICITDEQLSIVYRGDVIVSDPHESVHSITDDDLPIIPQFTGLLDLELSSGKQPGIALVKSVINLESGVKSGVIILYILEKDLAKLYSAYNHFEGETFIINADETVISSSEKGMLASGFESIYDGTIGNGSSLISDESGEKFILTSARLSDVDWQVVNKVNLAEVTQDAERSRSGIFLIIGIGLVLAIVMSYLVSLSIAKRIMNLSRTMTAFSKTQSFDLQVEVNSTDEIGQLGQGFNNMMDDMKQLLEEKKKQGQFVRKYELRLLQAQTNPHFLYNALETIIMLQELDMKHESIDAAKNLASFYRLTLSNGNEYISVNDEIELSSNYLSIQKYRYIEYMDYRVDVENDIYDYIMPKLTIQPILENAIDHGLKPKNGGTLTLTGRAEGGDILFIVRDNGVGMTEKQIDQLLNAKERKNFVGSFGIPSVDSKLRLLYGESYGLCIHSQVGEYTSVEIRIPQIDSSPVD